MIQYQALSKRRLPNMVHVSLLHNEKKDLTVMVNNSTNINKKQEYPPPLFIEEHVPSKKKRAAMYMYVMFLLFLEFGMITTVCYIFCFLFHYVKWALCRAIASLFLVILTQFVNV
jgi:hypothetical protein